MLATNLRHGLRHPAQAGREEIRINAVSAPLGDVPLFEKIFCINGLGDIQAVESGYEEGCEWGAKKKPRR